MLKEGGTRCQRRRELRKPQTALCSLTLALLLSYQRELLCSFSRTGTPQSPRFVCFYAPTAFTQTLQHTCGLIHGCIPKAASLSSKVRPAVPTADMSLQQRLSFSHIEAQTVSQREAGESSHLRLSLWLIN